MAENGEQMYQVPMSEGAAQIMREVERKTKQEAFDKRVEKLAQRAADYVEKYGEDDYRSVMLTSFLDVSLYMQEAIGSITDMKDAILCITDAMQCMDDVYAEMDSAFGETLVKRYGFWQRLKQKRKVKKVMRNNIGRITSMIDMIIGGHEMAMAIVEAMRKMGIKLQKNVVKMNEKQARAKQKAQNTNVGPLPESEGKKKVDEILRMRRGEQQPENAQPAPPAAGKPGNAPDDYSDIL